MRAREKQSFKRKETESSLFGHLSVAGMVVVLLSILRDFFGGTVLYRRVNTWHDSSGGGSPRDGVMVT